MATAVQTQFNVGGVLRSAAATLSIVSEPGVGTTVEIRIPADFTSAEATAARNAS